MTTTSMPAPQPAAPAPHLYTEPSGRSWDLDRDFLDYLTTGWAWDGQPYSPAAGPVLRSMAAPARREPLCALACCSGLWQVPLSAPGDIAHLLDVRDRDFQAWAGSAAEA